MTEEQRKMLQAELERLRTWHPYSAIKVWVNPTTQRAQGEVQIVHNPPRRTQ